MQGARRPKHYNGDHIVFVNNHFGRVQRQVRLLHVRHVLDVKRPGNVWSRNVWSGTGAAVAAKY